MAKKQNAQDIVEEIKKENKVMVMVPVDTLNENEPFICGINGCIYSIPRGKMVEVPSSIAEIISRSLTGTIEAQSKIKVIVDGQEA